MRHFNISDDEKNRILEMHDMRKPNVDEQKLIFDDPSNQKAINSWMRDGERKRYTFDIKEPFFFDTTNETENNILKFVLTKARVKYDHNVEKLD